MDKNRLNFPKNQKNIGENSINIQDLKFFQFKINSIIKLIVFL